MADDGISTKVSVLGDKEYKASLTDIGRQLTLLNTGMGASQSAFSGQGDSMDAVKAKGKDLQAIYDTQTAKVKLIAEQLNKAKAEYGENSTQAQNLEIALNRATTTMNKAGKEIQDNDAKLEGMGDSTEEASKSQEELDKSTGKAAGAIKDEGKEADGAEKENSKLGDALKKTAAVAGGALVMGVQAATVAMAAMAAAAAVAIKAGFDMAVGAGVYADDLLTLSDVTSISTDTLQEWSYAANFMDTDVSVITKSMAKMTKTAGDAANGNKTAAAKFKALGVDIYDASGKLRDSEAIFADAIDALGKVGNETERDALAMDLFGKSAQELNPLIKAGGDGLKALGEEARNMGTVFSADALAAMGSFDDSMQRVNATSEAMKNSIGLVLIPAFQPLMDTAAETMGSIAKILQDGIQTGDIEDILKLISDAVDTGLTGVMTLIENALPGMTTVISTLIDTVVKGIPGLIDKLTPAATGLMQTLLNTLSTNSTPIMESAVKVVEALGKFIVENTPKLIETAGTILTNLVTYITDNAGKMLDGATEIIDGIVKGITEVLPKLIPAAVEMMAKLAVELVAALPNLIEKLPEITAAIIKGLQEIDWLELGTNLIKGLAGGLSSAGKTLIDSITQVFKDIWTAIKGVFGIASPSTVAAEAGDYILKGLLQGFSEAIGAAVAKVKEIFGKIWDAIKSIFGFGGESAESKEAKTAGKDIMTGMTNGINDNKSGLTDAVRNIAKDVLKTLREGLGIAAGSDRSTESEKYGKWVAWGVDYGLKAITMDNYTGGAGQILTAVTGALWKAFGVEGTGLFGTGGNSAKKFEQIGEAVNKAIADGIKANAENGQLVKDALKYVAESAFESAIAEMELGITGTTSTAKVNAAVKTAAEAANQAAVDVLTSALGGKTAQPWVDGVKAGMTTEIGKPIGVTFTTGVKEGITKGTIATTDAAKTLVGAVKGAMWLAAGVNGSTFESIGDAIASGVARGINNGSSKIISAAKSAAQSAYNSAKAQLGIRSPSRVMMEIGEQFDAGFAKGIDGGLSKVLNSARNLSSKTAGMIGGSGSRSDLMIDYDRLGEAVASANRKSGAFNQQIIMDGQLVGQTVEPSVSRASYKRGQQSIAGRSSRLALV